MDPALNVEGPVRGGACRHCGLPAPGGELFCCYGCELAFCIRAEGKDDHARLYGTLTFILILSMIVMMLSLFLYAEDVFDASGDVEMAWLRSAYRWASWLLATPVMLLGGWPLLRRAMGRLRAGHLSMDALIAVGALAAYALSTHALWTGASAIYFESAVVAVVLATYGRYLESNARSRSSRSLGRLLDVSLGAVRVSHSDGSLQPLSASQIVPGMRVHVDPDQVVPVDLRLEVDTAEIDLAVLSGEARPVLFSRGDMVPAGAAPIGSGVVGTALRPAKDSAVERLAALARSLVQHPSVTLRWADRFAALLTPVACALGLLTFAYWTRAESLDAGILNALAVVLVACPCAYVIASPLVHWLVLREAFARGVLIRNAEVLEALAQTRRVAFDKTGTLTAAQLSVTSEWIAHEVPRTEVLSLLRALEEGNAHPLARALFAHAGEGEPAAITGRRFVAGRGVEATDGRGRRLFVGMGADGRTLLERDGTPIAAFHLEEALRPEAAAAVDLLKASGVQVVLLSGDDAGRAKAVADKLGIDAHARLSPEQKVAHLQALGAGTAMVGDGVNDVPALAGRLTSFTLGGAAQLAKGVAQVTLIEPDLRLVPWTLALARRGMRRVKWLMATATAYNLVFVALAAGGALRPVWAGLSMLISSLLSLAFASSVGGGYADEQETQAAASPISEAAPC